jgi:hypothetical protein
MRHYELTLMWMIDGPVARDVPQVAGQAVVGIVSPQ